MDHYVLMYVKHRRHLEQLHFMKTHEIIRYLIVYSLQVAVKSEKKQFAAWSDF